MVETPDYLHFFERCLARIESRCAKIDTNDYTGISYESPFTLDITIVDCHGVPRTVLPVIMRKNACFELLQRLDIPVDSQTRNLCDSTGTSD